MQNGFWKNRRVLVTGHTGFKGGWLCLMLQYMGARVVGYSLPPPTEPSLFKLADIGAEMKSIEGDIRDFEHLRTVIEAERPEIVIHMAAQPIVRYSYTHPVETYATNVMGTVHLFEAVRAAQCVKAIVNITSDKCYENQEWVWGYRENEPMGGYDPYSSSKGCAELVTSAYRRSYFNEKDYEAHGVALASARAGNVIGGGDWAEDRLIPDFIRAILEKEPLVLRNPGAIRPWQHVLEPLTGYLMLAERLYNDGHRYGEGWNFGPEDSDVKSVRWIADYLTKSWGDGATWQQTNEDQPHEAHHLKLDCSKANNILGWVPRWSLQDALDSIVTWYRAYVADEDMRAVCYAQIEAYLAAAERPS